MTDASDSSPKGVADMEEPSLEAVVGMIRDRREGILSGQIKPSPVRKSLFSVDDEELKTYRVEIQTDNVVKRALPPRFSQSGKEEYLAEFDMVDTDGDFIPPESLLFRTATPTSSQSGEMKKITVRDLVTRTGSKEDSHQGSPNGAGRKGGAKPHLGERVKTVRDLLSRSFSKEGSLNGSLKQGSLKQGSPKGKKGAEANALPPRTPEKKQEEKDDKSTSMEGVEVGVEAMSHRASEHAIVDESAAPSDGMHVEDTTEAMPPPVRETHSNQSASPLPQGAASSSSPMQEGLKIDASATLDTQTSELKHGESHSPSSHVTPERDVIVSPSQEALEISIEKKAKPSPLGLRFSPFRKRALAKDASHKTKGPKSSIEVVTPPRPATEDDVVTPQRKQQHKARSTPPMSESAGVSKATTPSEEHEPVDQVKKTEPPPRSETPLDNGISSRAVEEHALDSSPSLQVDKMVPTAQDSDNRNVTISPPALAQSAATQPKTVSLQDDDTQSMTASGTESFIDDPKKRPSFPGEAVVERFLERFFDKVTCTCINDRCVSKESKEVPSYMVVEIQKIHQKAQLKKAEIEAKKQARRSKKKEVSGKKRSGLAKTEDNTKAMPLTPKKQDPEKAIESPKKNKGIEAGRTPPSPPRKAPPQWGEKVLEQESVNSESSSGRPVEGVTVGQFIQKRFEILEHSLMGGHASVDDESAGAGTMGEPEREDRLLVEADCLGSHEDGAILNIQPVKSKKTEPEASRRGPLSSFVAKKSTPQEERVIILSPNNEDGSESLLDAVDGDESLLDDDDSDYTTELIQIDFDPTKLGKNSADADMYLAREVLRRYAEITGISLDELIEDVVDESLASLTLDTHGFPVERDDGSLLDREADHASV